VAKPWEKYQAETKVQPQKIAEAAPSAPWDKYSVAQNGRMSETVLDGTPEETPLWKTALDYTRQARA
jgi:hypothetical protein